MSTGAKVLTGVLATLGVLVIVAGLVYFFVPPADLPDFWPGHDNLELRHKRRGGFLGLIGLILLGLAALTVYRTRPLPVRDEVPPAGDEAPPA